MSAFVDVETPYMGKTREEVALNIRYARACVRDCLLRGEIPFASHIFFTQPGILDDNVPHEREKGILAGKALIEKLNARTIVYTDRGISPGMQLGIDMAKKAERNIEFRSLGNNWEEKLMAFEKSHSHNSLWGHHTP